MQQLKPMAWPRPVPLLMWGGDYADIRERIRRDGRLERDEVWLPDSDDSWQTFTHRHRNEDFFLNWRELEDRDNARRAEANRYANERRAAQVAQAQQQWEDEQRRRQQAKQAKADREWQRAEQAKIPPWIRRGRAHVQQTLREIDAERLAKQQEELHEGALARKRWSELEGARAFWSQRNPSYGAEMYRSTLMLGNATIDIGKWGTVKLMAKQTYYLPQSVVDALGVNCHAE